MEYARSISLKIACLAILGSWLLLGITIILFLFGFIYNDLLQTIISVFGLFVAMTAIGVLSSLVHKCPNCNRRFLIETPGEKHESARKLGVLDHWATVVVDVLSNNYFVCMYCGEKCDL